MPPIPDDLSTLLDTGRDVRIPILAPNPVTDEDAEQLYAVTDDCVIGTDSSGSFVVEEDPEAVQRLLDAMASVGFVTVFHATSARSQELTVRLLRELHELRERVRALEDRGIAT